MSILSDEIDNDPTGKGYAGFLPDQPGRVVDLLNGPTETKLGLLDRTALTKWAVKTGMRSIIEDESTDKLSPLRASALAILDVLGGASNGIDFADPENLAIITAWKALGKLTPENAALMMQAAMVATSRAGFLGLPPIDEEMLGDR